MKLFVYSDRSFANNKDESPRVGYLIIMNNNNNRDNVISYATKKSRRFVRYVVGAETFELSDECDYAIVMQHYLKKILVNTLKVTSFNRQRKIIQLHYKKCLYYGE